MPDKQKKNTKRFTGKPDGAVGFAASIGVGGVPSALMKNAGAGTAEPSGALLAYAENAYDTGNLDAAEKNCLAVLKRSPKNAQALTLYGIVLQGREKYAKSVQVLLKSLSLNDRQAAAYNALGSAQRALGKFSESIKAFERALALEPTRAEILNNMGLAYREWGQFDRAADYYERALSLNPSLAEAWNGLVRTQRFTRLPERLNDLKQAVAAASMSKVSRKHALFALGKIYDDLGQYDDAFECYQQGNQQRLSPADADNACALMAQIRSIFSTQRMEAWPRAVIGQGEPRAVFILGMPRSGTTLVEQILSTHPDVVWGGELNYFTETARELHRETVMGSRKFPESVIDITERELTKIRSGFLKNFKGKQSHRKVVPLVVTDKTPFNFLYLGLIALSLPDSVILHCRRDPLDTSLSIYFTDFAKNQPFSTDLKTIGQYFNCYQETMSHWMGVPAITIHDVVYEDLVKNQEAESRRIIELCGLVWDEKCLAFHENRRLVSTPSDWQVRQPIYDASIGRWRHYEKYLAPLIDLLGRQGKSQDSPQQETQ